MGVAAVAALAVAALLFKATPDVVRSGTASSTPGTASSRAVTAARTGPLPAVLPVEARQTLALIARGGPFPHPQDGRVFGNYEGHLPAQPRGWYHEYTVQTPGLSHRGTRRIITGGTPPRSYWYTADHYASFRAFEVPAP